MNFGATHPPSLPSRGVLVGVDPGAKRIGLAVTDGEEGTQSAKARTFGDWLARETGLPVMFWDERLSSSTAETLLWAQGETPSKDTGRIDGLAAQVILQSYLQGRSA
jgi:putative Holliday junction resolvase